MTAVADDPVSLIHSREMKIAAIWMDPILRRL